MRKFIEVYDDLVSPYIQDFIETLLLKNSSKFNIKWFHLWNLTDKENTSKTEEGFGFNFRWLNEKSKREISHPWFDSLMLPLYSFCINKNIIPIDIFLARSFLQTPSPSSGILAPHTDMEREHSVCLYYVNDSDGDTIFYDNDQNEIKRVSPKKGRIVFFDGSILHAGSSPSKFTRVIINYNFRWGKI